MRPVKVYPKERKLPLKERKKYAVRDVRCWNRKCFVPFSGNGVKICRLFETGNCPIEHRNEIKLEI